MAKKPAKSKTLKEDVDTAIQNQKTIEMKPNKSNQMAQAITLMQAMSGDEINHLLQSLQQNSQTAAASIPNDAAAKNAASIAMKGVVTEELNEIFGGEELTEDFKEKISTLFEAAVNTRVVFERNTLEEEFNQKLEEETAQLTESLTDKIDTYLSYVADEWMKENEVAIEKGIRTEIAEQFLHGLKNLCNEFNITIPEDKVDLVEEQQKQIENLKNENNRLMSENIEAQEILAQSIMEDSFEQVAEGLAMTDSEKFRTLAESVDFEGDVDAYKKKLNIIKEQYFVKKTSTNTDNKSLVLSESVEADTTNSVVSDPLVSRYADAISRAVKV